MTELFKRLDQRNLVIFLGFSPDLLMLLPAKLMSQNWILYNYFEQANLCCFIPPSLNDVLEFLEEKKLNMDLRVSPLTEAIMMVWVGWVDDMKPSLRSDNVVRLKGKMCSHLFLELVQRFLRERMETPEKLI